MATPTPSPDAPADRNARLETWIRVACMLIVLIFLGILLFIIFFRFENLDPFHWFVSTVSFATILSVVLYWLTPTSTGTVDWKELGVKLGGAAAVGVGVTAVCVGLVRWIDPTRPNGCNALVVRMEPDSIPNDPLLIKDGDLKRVTRLNNTEFVAVFLENKDEGWFVTEEVRGKEKRFNVKYTVHRSGKIDSKPGAVP
jgi:hypothetical protein